MNIKEEITKVTGLSPAVQDEILVRVKDNIAKLDSCSGPHNFNICLDRRTREPVENPTPQQMFGARWRCSKCGGDVETTNKKWYERGLVDGYSQPLKAP